MKKILCFIITALLFFVAGGTMSKAQEEPLPTPDTYVDEILDAMPDDAKELLPEEDTSGDIAKEIDTKYLLSLSLTFLKKALSDLGEYLAVFLIAVVIGALSHRIEEAFSKSDTGIASLLSTLVISLEAFSVLFRLINEVNTYIIRINAYMLTASGVMGAVLTLGGGYVEASKSTFLLASVVSVLGSLIGTVLMPVIRISFASALSSTISDKVNLSSIGSFARSLFTFLIGFLSTICVVTLTFQTMLAQAEDTLMARGIKFAASSSIPLVGGAVSDSVRTMGAAVTVIKKNVGAVGAFGIVIMTLYPLSLLVSAKLAVVLAKTSADLLGVQKESKIFSEVGSIINMLMATIAILSVLYIFVMALFASTAVSLG